MTRTVLLAAGLAVMWVALWGDASPGTIIAGALAGLAVVVLVPRAETDRVLVLRPLAAVRFVLLFLTLLVISTATVLRQVLSAGSREIVGELLEIELRHEAYPVRTIIAHSTSLTPGTLTVDIGEDGRTLLVHVIDGDLDAARRAIRAIEDRAVAAFAPKTTTDRPREEKP
jgi:multisubunit Na+/H+ antiporter MnhE subunit